MLKAKFNPEHTQHLLLVSPLPGVGVSELSLISPARASGLRGAHAGTGRGEALIKVGSVSISLAFSGGLSDVPAALLLEVMFSGFSCTGVIGNNLKYIF